LSLPTPSTSLLCCRAFASFEVTTTESPYSNVNWETHVVLQSNESKPVEYVVAREAAKMSGLIKDMLDDEDTASKEKTVIPIPNVNGNTLKYVIHYMEHHYNNKAETIEKPLKGKIDDVISEWDKKFLFTDLVKNGNEKEHELLIESIMAANFLNIKDMLDLTCACVASMIKGKTPEQIRALFNIENDFTPDEEEKIREENRWCEDS
jgi:S-phase kinase-associated protein 1